MARRERIAEACNIAEQGNWAALEALFSDENPQQVSLEGIVPNLPQLTRADYIKASDAVAAALANHTEPGGSTSNESRPSSMGHESPPIGAGRKRRNLRIPDTPEKVDDSDDDDEDDRDKDTQMNEDVEMNETNKGEDDQMDSGGNTTSGEEEKNSPVRIIIFSIQNQN